MSTDKQYLRALEISELTGASIRTVRRWISNETLPSVKLGGARLVAMEDLDAQLSPSREKAEGSTYNLEEYDEDSEQ